MILAREKSQLLSGCIRAFGLPSTTLALNWLCPVWQISWYFIIYIVCTAVTTAYFPWPSRHLYSNWYAGSGLSISLALALVLHQCIAKFPIDTLTWITIGNFLSIFGPFNFECLQCLNSYSLYIIYPFARLSKRHKGANCVDGMKYVFFGSCPLCNLSNDRSIATWLCGTFVSHSTRLNERRTIRMLHWMFIYILR